MHTWTHTHRYMHTRIQHTCTHACTHTHYITLHYITLHYITLHYITLHQIWLHYIALHTRIHTDQKPTLRSLSLSLCTITRIGTNGAYRYLSNSSSCRLCNGPCWGAILLAWRIILPMSFDCDHQLLCPFVWCMHFCNRLNRPLNLLRRTDDCG